MTAEYYAISDIGVFQDLLYKTFESNTYLYWDWNSFRPGYTTDYFGLLLTGAIRIFTTGTYNFNVDECVDHCDLYINGVKLMSNTDTFTFTAGTWVRFKLELYEYAYGAQLKWTWKTPGTTTFVTIPLDNLGRQVYCAQSCVHGCCTADDTCICDNGWVVVSVICLLPLWLYLAKCIHNISMDLTLIHLLWW